MNEAARIRVEVVYAAPRRVIVQEFGLTPGSTLAEALQLAARDPAFSGVDLEHSPVGIFGRLARPNQVLEEGDRIEIYRPLAADPKTARRARALESAQNKPKRAKL